MLYLRGCTIPRSDTFGRLAVNVVGVGPLLAEAVGRLHGEAALDDLEART